MAVAAARMRRKALELVERQKEKVQHAAAELHETEKVFDTPESNAKNYIRRDVWCFLGFDIAVSLLDVEPVLEVLSHAAGDRVEESRSVQGERKRLESEASRLDDEDPFEHKKMIKNLRARAVAMIP
eukprot:2895570-Rhodomonas_salina.1